MITVDANLLIYAYNTGAPQHEKARLWLAAILSNETLHVPWSSIHTFLRLSTSTPVFDPALTPQQATTIVESWLARPNLAILAPGPRYWTIFRKLLLDANIQRDLVMDAHLAALAIEHDATLFTNDRDFQRFAGLRVVNPLV